MAPKKGNQHGKGYGRPPKTYSDEEVVDLGQEMIGWMKTKDDAKEPVVHISQFYSALKKIPRSEWRALRQRLCFLPYYEQAMDWLLVRLLTNGEMDKSYGNRYLPIYDPDIRVLEREVMQEKIDYEINKKLDLEKSKWEHPNDDKLDELIKAVKEKK